MCIRKAENPDAAGVFASLMGSNYSTNFNMPSVNTKINNNVLQQTNAADNYDRYQYQDNTIRQAAGDVVTDVIGNSTDTLDQFQGDVVRTVAEQLGVSEDSVKDMMESLGLTAFDLLNPENLAQLAMQLTGETSPMDLLMNDQFQKGETSGELVCDVCAFRKGHGSDQTTERKALDFQTD